MRRAIGTIMVGASLITACALAHGQTTAEQPPPKNIDRTLDESITIDAEKVGLNEFIAGLRKQTDTNITLNWNALTQAGLARDTPVTLHLKDLPYETVVRTLMEVLPAQKSRANYLVGDNTLTITTNAELGKGAVPRLYALDRVVAYSLSGDAGDAATHEKLLEQVLRAEMVRAGEPLDIGDAAGAGRAGRAGGGGHALAVRGGTMAANISERGHGVLARAVAMLSTPIKPGQYAPGTALTAAAKRGLEALGKAAGGQVTEATYLAIAKEPEKYRGALNFALLPGAAEEVAKEAPEIGGTVSDGGVVLIGPKKVLESRALFAAYDIREVIKRQIAASAQKPPPTAAQEQELVIAGVKKAVPVETWGGATEIGKRPSLLIGYEGILIVFATADEQRAVTMALAEMNR